MKKNFTRNHRNMRNGISLIEMMIAIILFGVVAAIGFRYSKNYYDTDLSAKQALVSSVMEQATQMSGAYDIYKAKRGQAPSAVSDLYAADTRILTGKPANVKEITTSGWDLNTSMDIDGAGSTDIAFIYKVDAPSSTNDKIEYCNVINNIVNSDWNYDAISDSGNSGATDEKIGTLREMYDKTSWDFKTIMCFANDDDDEFTFAFVKELN